MLIVGIKNTPIINISFDISVSKQYAVKEL